MCDDLGIGFTKLWFWQVCAGGALLLLSALMPGLWHSHHLPPPEMGADHYHLPPAEMGLSLASLASLAAMRSLPAAFDGRRPVAAYDAALELAGLDGVQLHMPPPEV